MMALKPWKAVLPRTTTKNPQALELLVRGAATELLYLRAEALAGKAALFGGARRLGLVADLGRPCAPGELVVDLLEAQPTVAELAAGLARHEGDAGRCMCRAHGGVGRVHALAARARNGIASSYLNCMNRE